VGIRIEKTDTPNVDSYVETPHTPSASELEEIFTQENENDTTNRSSSIQSGWAAAKKAVAKSNQKYATDFRFEEDVKLIKFISGEPMTFMQHWVNRQGKKSFISIGVLNLSEEEPQLQLMIVGVRLCGQLEKLHMDKKTGPLDRPDLYWAVSKSGTGTKTAYSITPVKERDLADDWDIDPVAAAELIKPLKPLGPDALYIPSKSELEEVARELAGQA
jgi:hypothetical protein